MAEAPRPIDPQDVAIATVLDPERPQVDEVEHLFVSLERFGGEMARAHRRVYCVGSVPDGAGVRLEALGVDVRVVDEVEPRLRFANKLAMLAGEAGEDTRLLVALDSDIVVAGDFSEHLIPGVLQAKQADGDLLTFEMWETLFDRFGLGLPPERHPTSLEPHWTHAYFNTGVLLIPAPALQPLHDAWLDTIRELLDARDVIPGLADHLEGRIPHYEGALEDGLEHLYFAEQWALAVARHELALPYCVLPLALNFPTITRDDQLPGRYIQDRFTPHAVRPLLIHHHHDFEPGLRPTGYEAPDAAIRRVSSSLFGATGRFRRGSATTHR